MAIYVHITDLCRKDINKQKYQSQVDAFAAKIEKEQRRDALDRFPPPYMKKRFERQIRLVAQERIVGDDVVVVFQRLLVRGGKEYAELIGSDYHTLPGVKEEDLPDSVLEAYIASRQDAPPPAVPEPDGDESIYLHSALNSSANIYKDYHCCETQLWVDRMSEDIFRDRLNLFWPVVFDTLDAEDTSPISVAKCKDANYGIAFRRIHELKTVILFTPFKGEPPIEEITSIYPDLLTKGSIEREVVLRKIRRAYPHALLLVEDDWFSVQKEKEGNMALSEEEIEVLESARANDGGYPLFINGRAGSGKSTILQFLFKEYLTHHIKRKATDMMPVYFACNDELLAKSSSSVRSLIHGALKEDSSLQPITDIDRTVTKCCNEAFLNFHTWLYSLVPVDRFPKESRIGYGQFKHWWEECFGRQQSSRKLFDADISWHVIRTYIKGISPEGILVPEDYLEFPEKQKSVTAETYRNVFEQVWKRFSEDQNEYGWWDDQDLVRYALENDVIKSEHPVVFCDEAQDFTRIELEVLYRLSLFSCRRMNSHVLPKIPFAFAGDPFQTLNPTGFRWETTKAFFTEKFIESFPGKKKKGLNYRELTFNYRSSGKIVKFCNSLQLLRKIIFDFDEIEPQKPWEQDEEMPSVFYFDRSNQEVINTLKNQSEIRIIVPCEEGGEADWVKQNGLESFVNLDDAGVPKNVVSPSRVKGLEFTRVVLFGFGESAPQSLKVAVEGKVPDLTGDGAIEPQYYLNRLYVAASRPRKRLFIVDTQDAINRFWNGIFAKQEDILTSSDDYSGWTNVCGQIIEGTRESWEDDREDPSETAEMLEKEAIIRKDRVLMRQAAQSYMTAKRPTDQTRCKAQALEYEKQFLKAAEEWERIKDLSRSIDAAWRSGKEGFEFILKLANTHATPKNTTHYKVANYVMKGVSLKDGVVLLKELVDAISNERFKEEVVTLSEWADAIGNTLDRMLKFEEEGTGLWQSCFNSIDEMHKIGVRINPILMGDAAYHAGLMKNAFESWEKVSPKELTRFEQKYLRAKAFTQPFPTKMESYHELLVKFNDKKEAKELVEAVRSENFQCRESTHHETLFLAKIILNDYDDATGHLEHITNTSVLMEFANKLIADRSGQVKLQQLTLSAIIRSLATNGQWTELFELLKERKISTQRGIKDTYPDLRKWIAENKSLISVRFAECWANTSISDDARNEIKSRVAEFLKDSFDDRFGWIDKIHPMVVGKAFERSNLFRLTLPYYEAVAGSSLFSEAMKRLAWQRWVLTKIQQTARDLEQGFSIKAEKGNREIRIKSSEIGFLRVEDIPEAFPDPLPDVNPKRRTISPKASPKTQGQTEVAVENAASTAGKTSDAEAPVKKDEGTSRFARKHIIDDLTLVFAEDGSRVNIQREGSMTTVSVFVAKQFALVDGENRPINMDSVIDINEFELKVDFTDVDKGKLLFATDKGIEFTVKITP